MATISVCVFVLVGLSMSLLLATWTRIARAPQITVSTFAAHLLVSIFLYSSVGLFANDATAYDADGINVAQRLGGDTSVTIVTGNGKELWPWALGFIYHWFGHQPVLGLILNAALAAALVPVIGLACTQLGWDFAATRAMWIAGFAPPLFIWSTFLLREASVNLTVAIVFSTSTLYLKTRKVRWLLVSGLVDVLLIWLRGPISVIILVGLVLGVVLAGRLGTKKISITAAIAFVALVVIAVPVTLRLFGALGESLVDINLSRDALARSASTSFGSVSSSSSIGGSVFVSLRQLPTAAFGPFPWEWSGGFGGLLTAIDGSTWILFAWYGIRAWRSKITIRGRWVCVAPAGTLLLAIALTSGNFGTLVRIRATELPLLACLIAVGMTLPRRKSRAANRVRDMISAPEPSKDPHLDGSTTPSGLMPTANRRVELN